MQLVNVRLPFSHTGSFVPNHQAQCWLHPWKPKPANPPKQISQFPQAQVPFSEEQQRHLSPSWRQHTPNPGVRGPLPIPGIRQWDHKSFVLGSTLKGAFVALIFACKTQTGWDSSSIAPVRELPWSTPTCQQQKAMSLTGGQWGSQESSLLKLSLIPNPSNVCLSGVLITSFHGTEWAWPRFSLYSLLSRCSSPLVQKLLSVLDPVSLWEPIKSH